MKAWLRKAAPYLLAPLAMVSLTLAGLYTLDPAGALAPAFTLSIEAGPGAAEGDRVSLEALRGQVVLLDFWASWCGPCQRSIPILNRIHDRYESFPVMVLGINTEPELPLDQLRAAHRAFGATFSTVRDSDRALGRAYGIRELPTLVLIDREGRIHQVVSGVPVESSIEAEIDSLLQ